jgi:hypothetical protein
MFRKNFQRKAFVPKNQPRFGGLNTVVRTGYIFNGGSSVDWQISKARILDEFRKEECLDYVLIPAGQVPGEEDNLDWIQEKLFLEVEPTFNAEDRRDEYLETSTDLYNEVLANIQGSGCTEAEKASERLKARNAKSDRESKIVEKVGEFERTFQSAHSAWTTKKNLHDKRVASVTKVFLTTLGPTTMAYIRRGGIFEGNRFRLCWRLLCDLYAVTSNKSKTILLELIQNAVYDNRNIAEHVEYMDGLMVQCEATDIAITPELRGQFLINSVKRANVTRYDHALEYHEEANTSWEQVFSRLQEIDSQFEIDEARKRQNGVGRISNLVNSVSVDATVNNVGKGKAAKGRGAPHAGSKLRRPDLKCGSCGREGHTDDKCFKNMTCGKCGMKGHANFQCPQGKVAPKAAKVSFAETASEKVQLTRAFSNKIPKPSG